VRRKNSLEPALGEQLQFFFAVGCAGGTKRIEQGWHKQWFEVRKPFVAIACNEGLACVFDFGSAFVREVKNHDKHEARCDPQARIKWAAVGFVVVWSFSGKRQQNQVSCREKEGGTQKT